MESIIKYLWLMPTAPLVAAGLGALLPKRQRRLSAVLAIGAISFSFVLACMAFLATLNPGRATSNFRWFEFGSTSVRLGWVLDPLGAIMAVMVTLVSLLIFIYSLGYMAKDEKFTRFFCFLALFAAAMLGLIIANSLLLFFICWELVGLASYLLIGFGFKNRARRRRPRKRSSSRASAILDFWWGCSCSMTGRARSFFMTAGTAAWIKPSPAKCRFTLPFPC